MVWSGGGGGGRRRADYEEHREERRQAAAVDIKVPPLVKWAYWHIASPCRTRRRLASAYRRRRSRRRLAFAKHCTALHCILYSILLYYSQLISDQ